MPAGFRSSQPNSDDDNEKYARLEEIAAKDDSVDDQNPVVFKYEDDDKKDQEGQ